LSFAAFGNFVEFGDDAVTFLKSLSFTRYIRLFFLNLTIIINILIAIIRGKTKNTERNATIIKKISVIIYK